VKPEFTCRENVAGASALPAFEQLDEHERGAPGEELIARYAPKSSRASSSSKRASHAAIRSTVSRNSWTTRRHRQIRVLLRDRAEVVALELHFLGRLGSALDCLVVGQVGVARFPSRETTNFARSDEEKRRIGAQAGVE
jgi:hypothetical protein